MGACSGGLAALRALKAAAAKAQLADVQDGVRLLREEADVAWGDPDKPVLTIAYEVGFNSKSSFNSAFLKYKGQTPVAFRKKNG